MLPIAWPVGQLRDPPLIPTAVRTSLPSLRSRKIVRSTMASESAQRCARHHLFRRPNADAPLLSAAFYAIAIMRGGGSLRAGDRATLPEDPSNTWDRKPAHAQRLRGAATPSPRSRIHHARPHVSLSPFLSQEAESGYPSKELDRNGCPARRTRARQPLVSWKAGQWTERRDGCQRFLELREAEKLRVLVRDE